MLDFIASQPFAMVTLEKSTMLHYPPLNGSGEAKVIQQAKWIKQRAPDKAVMFCERALLAGCLAACLLVHRSRQGIIADTPTQPCPP